MNTLVSNTSLSGTLIALDIAKKHHDAKIRHPDGRTSYLRLKIHWKGSTDCLRSPLPPMMILSRPLNLQLIITATLHGGYISRE